MQALFKIDKNYYFIMRKYFFNIIVFWQIIILDFGSESNAIYLGHIVLLYSFQFSFFA